MISLRVNYMSGETVVVLTAATNTTIFELKESILQASDLEHGTIVENLVHGNQILRGNESLQNFGLTDGETLLATFARHLLGTFTRTQGAVEWSWIVREEENFALLIVANHGSKNGSVQLSFLMVGWKFKIHLFHIFWIVTSLITPLVTRRSVVKSGRCL